MNRLNPFSQAVRNVFRSDVDRASPESPGAGRNAGPVVQEQARTGGSSVPARAHRSFLQKLLNDKIRGPVEEGVPTKRPGRKLQKKRRPPGFQNSGSSHARPAGRGVLGDLAQWVQQGDADVAARLDIYEYIVNRQARSLPHAAGASLTDQAVLQQLARWVQDGSDADVAARLDIYEYIVNRQNRSLPHAAGASLMDQAVLQQLARWVQDGSDADVVERLAIYECIVNRPRVPAEGAETPQSPNAESESLLLRQSESRGSYSRESPPRTTAKPDAPAAASSGERVMARIERSNRSRRPSPLSNPLSDSSYDARKALKKWSELGPENEKSDREQAADVILEYAKAQSAEAVLDLGNFNLSAFPPGIPAWTKKINFQLNSLREMPSVKDLPPDAELNLFGNPITALPPDWEAIASRVTIKFDPDSLPIDTRIKLEARFDEKDYSGPKFEYPNGASRDQAANQLVRSVNTWTDDNLPALQDWTAFRTEENSASFATFLDRLREVGVYKRASNEAAEADPDADPPQDLQAFRLRIVNLLKQLEADPELRAACFGLAHDALGNCENRIALRLMDMETLCLDKRFEDGIRKGDYDKKQQEVINYCKGQYRRKLIAEAAYRKIEGVREEALHVETFLIFFNKFAEKYRLPVTMSSTPGNVVNVTEQEFAELDKKLGNRGLTTEAQNANNQSFLRFLATSSAMNLLLEKLISPDELKTLQTKIRQQTKQRQDDIRQTLEEVMGETLSLSSDEQAAQIKNLQAEYLSIESQVQETLTAELIAYFVRNRTLNIGLDPEEESGSI